MKVVGQAGIGVVERNHSEVSCRLCFRQVGERGAYDKISLVCVGSNAAIRVTLSSALAATAAGSRGYLGLVRARHWSFISTRSSIDFPRSLAKSSSRLRAASGWRSRASSLEPAFPDWLFCGLSQLGI